MLASFSSPHDSWLIFSLETLLHAGRGARDPRRVTRSDRWGGFGLGRSADLDLRSGDEDRWRRPWVEQMVRGGNEGTVVAPGGGLASGGDSGAKGRG
jgi:hypothetical protein